MENVLTAAKSGWISVSLKTVATVGEETGPEKGMALEIDLGLEVEIEATVGGPGHVIDDAGLILGRLVKVNLG